MSQQVQGPGKSDIFALAKAVMAPDRKRVLLINANNAADGWVSLDEAVRSGRTFTVRYRDDLMCLDGDSELTARAAVAIADQLEAIEYRPVVWATGSPGHVQVVVHIPDDRVRADTKEKARECGIDVRQDSRAPLAPHRLGLPVALLAPETVEEALRALGAPSEAGQPENRPRASARTWGRIRWGDPTAQSGSECAYRVACGLVGRGFTPEHGYALLLDPRNKGGEALRKRLRERGERAARAWWFDTVWLDAKRYVAENPPVRDPTEARLAIVQMRSEADRWRWSTVEVHIRPGAAPVRVAGSSVRRALEGLLDIASAAGTVVPYIGERHLADMAGFGSRWTVRKCLRALAALGWITEEEPGKGRAAATYRLLLDGVRRNGSRTGEEDLRTKPHGSDPQQRVTVSKCAGRAEEPGKRDLGRGSAPPEKRDAPK